jgi:6-phosphogluconolactonase (cycloisomerase 2 family)
MRMRNLVALGAGIGFLTGGLALIACGGDDTTNSAPGTDAGADATKADGGTGTPDTGVNTDAAADTGTDTGTDAGVASNVLYIMSNDPTSGKNAVFAYKRSTTDGSLTPISGSPFPTGGTGIGNPLQALGPDDSDYQLIASADHKHLFAANGGSDNISVFTINADGTLTAVTGSPFASGGTAPVSLALAGSNLLVTNQDYDLGRALTGVNANFATLTVSATGALSSATGITPTPTGLVPTALYPTTDGTLVFGDNFTFPSMGVNPGLLSFSLASSGALTANVGSPYSIPSDTNTPDAAVQADQLVLGMALSPVNKVLYVNYVIRGEVSAWTYTAAGALTNVGSAKVSGGAPCWVRVSSDGNFVYTTDTATDQVSVLSATNGGTTLSEIQALTLSGAGPTLVDAGGNSGHTSSEAYDEELSPDGKYLYVESERLSNDPSYTEGNMIHVLVRDTTTGMLTESTTAVALDPDAGVPITARSEGLVVF